MPESGERELRARLRAFPATRALAAGTLTSLRGGFSNAAWRVDVCGGPWYARLGAPDAAALGVDRMNECALLELVGKAGIAPPVLACEPASRLLVTRFVDARPWRIDEAARERNIERMALLLRRLHALPASEAVARRDWPEQAHRLAAGLSAAPGDFEIHQRAEGVLQGLAARGFVATLCHNDPHHLNILDDGERLWLVDWEYGSRGDPLFDLAGYISMHGLDPAATAKFLEAYGGLDVTDLRQLRAVRWVFDYVQWLWYRRCAGPGAGEAFARAQRLAQRLLHCDNPTATQVDG